MAAKAYEHVYTVEIFEPLYKESKDRALAEGLDNIHFYLGDSLVKLEEIAPLVREGGVFFIDAHISGCDSSWNNSNRVPLIEEIEIILKSLEGPSLFIIDDARLWLNEVWDWSHVTNDKICSLFGDKISTSFLKNDRFFVFTN